jgi:hypothetical protein
MRSTTTTAINRTDAAQLRQLEDVIQTAERWEMEKAKALHAIKKRGLWRGQYESFRWRINSFGHTAQRAGLSPIHAAAPLAPGVIWGVA